MEDRPSEEVVVTARSDAFFFLPEIIPGISPYVALKSSKTSRVLTRQAMTFPPISILYGGTAPSTYASRILTSLRHRSREFQPTNLSRIERLKTGSPIAKSPANLLLCSSQTR